MAKLSKEQIDHLAKLARIGLTDEEKNKFSSQLTDILEYVEKLQRVETAEIVETSQVTGLENVYRKDVASELTQVDKDKNINRDKLLKNAPDQKDNYIKVKAVLE